MLREKLKASFAVIQQVGKSLMLPVSVLPAAGILLGIGSAPFTWMPTWLAALMAQSGGAVFGSLPVIFAVATAVGMAGNDGVAALAALVGYVVMLATMGVMASLMGIEPKTIMGFKSMDTGVFGGILIGMIAAYLFKRYYKIQLPSYLGFFAGKRFVPTVTAFAAIFTGVVLSLIWPYFQSGIDVASHAAAYGNPTAAATIYGFVERLLIPFGLHHIWNVPFFFEIGEFTKATGEVVRGDVNRFFAGDPTAGILGGAYLFKMWGLPAAGFAIWHTARPENRARVGSLMVSAALTSFLTGITEPLEFAFLFVAPILYVVHAFLAAGGQLLFGVLGAKLGFTFSQGFIDYVLYFAMGTKPWLVLIFGPIWAAIYYVVFRTMIVKLNLKTPGREVEDVAVASSGATEGSRAASLVAAFGGRDNLANLDSCITRLRVEVKNPATVNQAAIKSLGATGVMAVGNGVQAVFGSESEVLKNEMEEYLAAGGGTGMVSTGVGGKADAFVGGVAAAAAMPARAPSTMATTGKADASKWLAALGGRDNVYLAEACAETRLRVFVKDLSRLNESALLASGVQAVMKISDNVIHLVVGGGADAYEKQLKG